jgi:hypothetical protein
LFTSTDNTPVRSFSVIVVLTSFSGAPMSHLMMSTSAVQGVLLVSVVGRRKGFFTKWQALFPRRHRVGAATVRRRPFQEHFLASLLQHQWRFAKCCNAQQSLIA